MEEIQRIKELLAKDRPGDWDALPDIDLYMDQVVSYLPRQSVGGKAPSMTSAMINNYVKDGLLPRACGKRYHKEHQYNAHPQNPLANQVFQGFLPVEQQSPGNHKEQRHCDFTYGCQQQGENRIDPTASRHLIQEKAPILRMVEHHQENRQNPHQLIVQPLLLHCAASKRYTSPMGVITPSCTKSPP